MLRRLKLQIRSYFMNLFSYKTLESISKTMTALNIFVV